MNSYNNKQMFMDYIFRKKNSNFQQILKEFTTKESNSKQVFYKNKFPNSK